MSQSENQHIYVYCEICRRNIPLTLPKDAENLRKGGLLPILSIHGLPKHETLFYLDRQNRVRGCECPTLVGFESGHDSHKERKKRTLSLEKLVGFFGASQKVAISNFVKFIVQTLVRNNTYLVESEGIDVFTLCENIKLLFSNQGISPNVIKEGDTSQISGAYPTVFHLGNHKFIADGLDLKTPYFEHLVKDILKEEDNFYSLQNELSKLIYSYNELKRILAEDKRTHKDTDLAREIAIDLPLMQILVKMAENEGILTKDRIEFNGFGRALRSF